MFSIATGMSSTSTITMSMVTRADNRDNGVLDLYQPPAPERAGHPVPHSRCFLTVAMVVGLASTSASAP